MKFMDSLGTAARRVVVVDDNVAANSRGACVSRFTLRASNSLTILSLAAEVPKCPAHPTNDESECYS